MKKRMLVVAVLAFAAALAPQAMCKQLPAARTPNMGQDHPGTAHMLVMRPERGRDAARPRFLKRPVDRGMSMPHLQHVR